MKAWLGGILLIFLVSDVKPQQREQLFPGARPFGLGETFVAIADDGNAIYWNPAGLPYLKREEFNFMYSNLYGAQIGNYYASYTRPFLKKFAFGADWLRYGFDDDELEFGSNHWNLAVGYSPIKQLAFGGNVKYIKTSTKLYDTNLWDAAASGWGIDLGILANKEFKNRKFLKELKAGLMFHDVTNTWIRFNSGTKEVILHRNLRAGFCYKLFDVLSWKGFSFHDPIIAVDIDDRFHLGTEVWFMKDILPCALRGGVQQDLHTDEGLTWSAGFSIQKDFFRIDYAYSVPPVLPATQRFSFAILFNFNPQLVEIDKPYIEPVFSSLIRDYNKPGKTIGKVWLKNKQDEPLEDVKVNFNVKNYVQTTCWQGRLDTGMVVDLTANFSDDILKIDETVKSLNGEIEVIYKVRDRQYQEKSPVRFPIYGNRSIRWDVPGRAVVFITQEDSLVRSFAEAAIRDYDIPYAKWFLNRETADAVKIYEALRAYKIEPTPDPNASYSSATSEGYYVDTITWPDALLSKPTGQRKGDCEDLAILYASLLESIGIHTALMKTPGHIFMMFNTGIPAAHSYCLPFADQFIVKAKGYLWLPVETTYLKSSFNDAWEAGADNYHSAQKRNELEILFVEEEKINFPAITHAPIKRRWHSQPDSARIHPFIADNFRQFEHKKDQFIEQNYVQLLNDQPENPLLHNQLGCTYMGLSAIDSAICEFNSALQIDAAYAPALNNLGNVYFMKGDSSNLARARDCYENCLKTGQFKSGTYINLALLYQVMSGMKAFTRDSVNFHEKSYEQLERVIQLVGADSIKILALMGIAPGENQVTADQPVTKKQQKTMMNLVREAKKFINDSLAKLINHRPKEAKLETAGPTGDQADVDRQYILFWDFYE